MSFNVDFDEVDLNVCSDLVVQRYGWNFNSLDVYFLEPVSETGLSSDEATVVLWYQQVPDLRKWLSYVSGDLGFFRADCAA